MFDLRKKRKPEADSGGIHEEIKVTAPALEAYIDKSQGRRKYQQDNVFVCPDSVVRLSHNKTTRVLAVVCDGMGGMADGAKASETALEDIKNRFDMIKNTKTDIDIPGLFEDTIKYSDRRVAALPRINGKGSGTTFVAAIVEYDGRKDTAPRLYTASVGDSRIYLIRKNEGIMQLTRDHNYFLLLKQKVEQGEMTMEEAMAKKQKEALISFIGIGNVGTGSHYMDIRKRPIGLQFGDVVMLCSDGITKTLSDRQIYSVITSEETPMEDKAANLVDYAVRSNTRSQDNTSVAIIHYKNDLISKRGGTL